MTININICCNEAVSDECANEEALGGRTLTDARFWARRSGWTIKRGGYAICPECSWELEQEKEPNETA